MLEGLGRKDLAEQVKLGPAPEPRTTRPTATELALALGAHDPALRWLVTCAAEMGLRFAMACAIRPIDVRDGRLRLHGKMGRTTDVPLSARCAAMLAALPHGHRRTDTVLEILNGAPLRSPSCTMHKRWAAHKRAVGIRADIRLHDLRRNLAHALFNQTHDLSAVQKLLGHRQIESTLAYLHAYGAPLDAQQVSAAIAANLMGGTSCSR